MKKNKFLFISVLFLVIFLVQPQNFQSVKTLLTQNDLPSQLNITGSPEEKNGDLANIRDSQNKLLQSKVYDGSQQVFVVNDKAQFTKEDLSLERGTWTQYSDLDFLNRVRVADAMLGQDLMPAAENEVFSSMQPTGWKETKITLNGNPESLYRQSSLIGFQLSGEKDNIKNVFTGTQALNTNNQSSIRFYENRIAQYIKETGHHVRYRVTPIFRNVELVARGLRLEAQSVEDETISFDVYIFNGQPGYTIDYLTGDITNNG